MDVFIVIKLNLIEYYKTKTNTTSPADMTIVIFSIVRK